MATIVIAVIALIVIPAGALIAGVDSRQLNTRNWS
jgi:hypothetical protein